MNVFKLNRNKTKIAFLSVAMALFASSLIVSCAEEFESPSTITGTTLAELAATDTTLEIFTAAIAKTGIGISLGNINSGQHTVFAPTDSAFRAYFKASAPAPASNYDKDAGVIAYINTMSPASAITLATFTSRLQYHVVSSEVLAEDITTSQVFTTINAARLSLSKKGSNVYINANRAATGAKVKKLDIDGANGVIHTVDKFLTAISVASIYVNTTALGITIDYTKAPPTVTIGATVGSNYDVLSEAIKKTGLATTLRPNVAGAVLPDFTILAPDDAAMVAYLGTLSGGTVTDEATAKTYINSLTAGALTSFTDVIKYHVVTGRLLTTDMAVNQVVPTMLTGKAITITAVDLAASPYANLSGAKAGSTSTITSPDLVTNAGVVQRLSIVLLPQ